MEIIYTDKMREFAPEKVGKLDVQPDGIAEAIIFNGYAIKSSEKDVLPLAEKSTSHPDVIVVEEPQVKRRGNPAWAKKNR